MTRKSKREIERELDKMDTTPAGEYPQLDTLAEVLSYDWVKVEGEEDLYRREDSGIIHYMPPGFKQLLTDL